MAVQSKVRIGLVGFGWFGRMHCQVWLEHPDVELVGICDSSADAFEAGGKSKQDEFHTDAGEATALDTHDIPFFSSIKEMREAVEMDVVDVVTPESLHFICIEEVLSAHKHVIVEKPFTTSAQDARTLATLAAQVGKNIFVGNILRFDPRYVHVTKGIYEIGKPPDHMSLQRHFQRSALEVYGRVHPYFGACIHDIDIAIWSHGACPIRVLGRVSHSSDTGDVHTAVALLEWPGGETAVIQNAWLLASGTPAGFAFESTFFLPQQTFNIKSTPVVESIGARNSEWPEMFFWPQHNGRLEGALASELSHFIRCVQKDQPSSRIPLEQAVWGIEIAQALVHSDQTGKWVDMEQI